MMFLPYKYNNPTTCSFYGYRYSMSNCVFESAFEATLSKCECYPLWHQKGYQCKNYFKAKRNVLIIIIHRCFYPKQDQVIGVPLHASLD